MSRNGDCSSTRAKTTFLPKYRDHVGRKYVLGASPLLSSELGDPWGYRRLTTYSGYAAKDDAARGPPARPWLAGGVTITARLGAPESTAVVDPRAFTTGLMRAAKMHGAVLRQLRVPTWRFLDSHFADIGRRSTIEMPVQPEPALVE
jgi:hypothetical protein